MEDSSDLRKALQVMCVVPKAANDMMQVGRLQGFNVSRPSVLFFFDFVFFPLLFNILCN